MKYDNKFKINEKEVSIDNPVYFIADIASNHDGDLARAKELIVSKKSGSRCSKISTF